jgi:hypothetical protein
VLSKMLYTHAYTQARLLLLCVEAALAICIPDMFNS